MRDGDPSRCPEIEKLVDKRVDRIRWLDRAKDVMNEDV
jgi:hypothetical protein